MKHDMLRGLSLFYTAADTEIRESLNLPPFALAWSINMRVRQGEDAPTAYARLELQDSAAFEVDPENPLIAQFGQGIYIPASAVFVVGPNSSARIHIAYGNCDG